MSFGLKHSKAGLYHAHGHTLSGAHDLAGVQAPDGQGGGVATRSAASEPSPVSTDPHASHLGGGFFHGLVLATPGAPAIDQGGTSPGPADTSANAPAITAPLPAASLVAAAASVGDLPAYNSLGGQAQAFTGSTGAAAAAPTVAAADTAAMAVTPVSQQSNSVPPANDTGGSSGQGGSLLPSGYLSTSGNQIVDAQGNPVRIASVGWSGTDGLTFAPYGLWQSSLQQNIDQIKADGFNTIRVPWTDLLLGAWPKEGAGYAAINPALDPELVGKSSLQVLDQLVADAGKDGLKIIFDHHNDEGGAGGWGGQQANGLWFDSGPGTNGTDGSGTNGTVTAAKFLSDSVALAQRYAGNSTVIGFDIDNEPSSVGNINWGQGGPTDIHAMYTQVGDAMQAVNPGALIIAEGPEEWSGPAPGMPAGFGGGDLSGVATDPVSLTIPGKVVYSVHAYPPDLAGYGSYNAATQIAAMNAGWGYLETHNVAPVWVGEIGSNMTSSNDQTWIQGILDYMNGKDAAQGGPSFTGAQQPVGGSWWQWGSNPGGDPQGVETAWGSGVYLPNQQAATDQLLYKPGAVSAGLYLAAATVPDSVQTGVTSGQTTGNLWNQLVGNGTDTNPSYASGIVVTAVGTAGTSGKVAFNASSHTLTYTATAYNPLNPVDSFTYTLSDGHGATVTGKVAITDIAPANVIYDTVAGSATVGAPAGGWTVDSLAAGQTVNGSPQGHDTFIVYSDTTVILSGDNNTVSGGTGNRMIDDSGNNATVNLGNGNNQLYLNGTGNVVTTGAGNNTVWKPTGNTTITMGNGNQNITVDGMNNAISIGSGTSTLNLATDGSPAGNEKVTVGGGTNGIYVAGTNDVIVVQGGTNNNVGSSSGLANVKLVGGSNMANLSGNSNIVAITAGTNTVNAPGNANTVTGGSGADTIWVGGTGNSVTGGSGTDVVTLSQGSNTITAGAGHLTLNASSTNNTLALGLPGVPEEVVNTNVVASNDVVDLRASLGATSWDDVMSDIGNYLSVSNAGSTSTIWIDPDGTGSKPAVAVAAFNNTPGLTVGTLLAHAIVPQAKAADLSASAAVTPDAAAAGPTTSADVAVTPITGADGTTTGFTYAAGSADDTIVTATGQANVVYAGTGADVIYSLGADTISASAANSQVTVIGGGNALQSWGADFVSGSSAGGNVIAAGAGNATLTGGGNGDIFVAGSGNDQITAAGSAVLYGNAAGSQTNFFAAASGNASVVAGAGDMMVEEGAGQNVTYGGAGSTTVNGGSGNDGTGNDWVVGGAGSMVVNQGGGTDDVIAGAGTMVVNAGIGQVLLGLFNGAAGGDVTVNGFNGGSDRIFLVGYGADAAQTALAGAQVTAAGTALNMSDGSRIVLAGVTTALDGHSVVAIG